MINQREEVSNVICLRTIKIDMKIIELEKLKSILIDSVPSASHNVMKCGQLNEGGFNEFLNKTEKQLDIIEKYLFHIAGKNSEKSYFGDVIC
jgi:hypothetical protein